MPTGHSAGSGNSASGASISGSVLSFGTGTGTSGHSIRGSFNSPGLYGMPSPSNGFTPEMRDRQARGKDPYGSGDEFEAASRIGSIGASSNNEPYHQLQKKQKATAILDNPELLMIQAQRTGELMSVRCGYDAEGNSEGRDGPDKHPSAAWSSGGGGGGGSGSGSSSRRKQDQPRQQQGASWPNP